jgi:phospholipid/cholesterol/gamma-HCH transport system substrate-binding protein
MQAEQSSAVKAGIFVLVGGVVVIGAIVVLGQRAQLFSARYTLVARFANAGGLIRGASVRVAGVNAGNVRSVEIVPAGAEPSAVRVEFDISRSYEAIIRHGARASIRTLGPLGDKYVEIVLGPSGTGSLQDGDEIETEPAADFYDIAEEARRAFQHANRIAEEVSATLEQMDQAQFVKNVHATAQSLAGLLERMEKGPSLVHTLLYDEEVAKMCEDLRVAARVLRETAERIQAGEGAAGMLVQSDKVVQAVADLSASAGSARSILEAIEKGEGAAHALVYSPEEREGLKALAESAEKLSDVLGKVREGEGTLGLLVNDPEVWEGLKRLLGSVEESRVLKYIVRRSVEKAAPDASEE